MEFYVASGRSIRAWSAKAGAIVRIFKNISQSDITVIVLDKLERKLFIG